MLLKALLRQRFFIWPGCFYVHYPCLSLILPFITGWIWFSGGSIKTKEAIATLIKRHFEQ